MRPKSIVLLLLALGCGLVASIGISQVMESRKNQGPSDEMQPILVAAADINPMDKFTPEALKLEEWPKSKVPQGALTSYQELEGKHLRSKLYKGEPVLAAKLAGQNDMLDASGHIPKGFVLCAVKVDPVSASGSLIRPGDRVDVLVYMGRNGNAGVAENSTRTILQDISVFAVDTMYMGRENDKDAANNAKTVSLLVTLNQAEKLTLASEMGSIRLVLRSAGDTTIVNSNGATPSELFNSNDRGNADAERKDQKKDEDDNVLNLLKQNQAPPDAKAPGFKMIVHRGLNIKEYVFPADGSMPSNLLNDSDSGADATPGVDPAPAFPPAASPPGGSLPGAPAGASSIQLKPAGD